MAPSLESQWPSSSLSSSFFLPTSRCSGRRRSVSASQKGEKEGALRVSSARQKVTSLLVLFRNCVFSLLLVSLLCCFAEGAKPKDGRPVTYGSAVSLVHVLSGFKLFSGKISWGSGSGQQAVTAIPSADKAAAANMLWIVSAPSSGFRRKPLDSPVLVAETAGLQGTSSQLVPALVTPGAAGEPVRCGSVILLEHGSSRGTLQATGASSPISSQKEVDHTPEK
ncbi:conserved hypothetical protein [Neospora caninum Liverpool]|uniref:MIR domain-containing protein n=1 Tax=Neospora caninum (strain Liverpool) TaxID=572307 RepID=F0VK16_NEOCL|nr:conserved hypothetical protein [Neospora caninum Liverpool]CBZ54061.1 conserved hypothetical protein [Neospora caninum Liverpool]|eukprot:XP_003884092.1 conserved hypothetical protein [Neospora caninum Liverpool]